MLVEIAIGDAYGAGFEFCERSKIDTHNLGYYFVSHDLGIATGKYTDDTQMSISIAEMLTEDREFTKENFAEAFVKSFKRDKRLGYAKRFQKLLETCNSGKDLLKVIKPESKRNGAAMRSVPLGLIQNKDVLLRVAKTQASITHNTKEGIISSQIIALSSHELIYSQIKIEDLSATIQKELDFSINTNWQKTVDCDAIQTINAVFTALLQTRKLSQLLIRCVDFGGDVDSVAAIALGLASLSQEYENDIDKKLLQTIENGAYGLDYLRQLDQTLQNKFPEMYVFVPCIGGHSW